MDVVPTPNKNMWTETMFTSHSVQTRCQGPCEMNRSEDSSVMTGTGSRFGGRRLRLGATQKMGGGVMHRWGQRGEAEIKAQHFGGEGK